MLDNKLCSTCNKYQNITDFYKNKSKSNGFSSQCKQCTKFKHKEYREKNRIKINLNQKLKYKEDPTVRKQSMVNFKIKNPQYNRPYEKIYKRNNKGKVNSSNSKYRASKLQRTPKWLTKDDWNKIEEYYIYAQFMTDSLGINYEVDHIIPLKGKNISGLHVPQNLQIITEEENESKGNKYNVR